ncbi:MAG TPA: hypothetical protein VMT35_09455 [Ignavibacteriaceae bacterium]|nr:hypothetical protein [Ignavibacteriaceae bacterium]
MELREIRLNQFESGAKRLAARLEKLEKKSRRFGYYRLIILSAGLVSFLLSYFYLNGIFIWIFPALALTAFGITTAVFNKIDFEIKKSRIWIAFKKDNIARMKIDWPNIPYKNFSAPEEDHPFENDLNITGKNSLHRLIDISTSSEGSSLLKKWLLDKFPSKKIILERQEIIKELIPLSGFRYKLMLNALLSSQKKLEGTKLSEWLLSSADTVKIKKILTALFLIIPINILLFILFLTGALPAYWTAGALMYTGIYFFNSKHVNELFERSLDIQAELGMFTGILEFIENYPALKDPKNKNLNKLCGLFLNKKNNPSSFFKRLNRINTAASFQKNAFFFLLLNGVFPYDFFFAYKLEKVKQELKDKLPEWLEVFYNLEALISLSNFAYLNPDYTFPSISDEKQKFIIKNTAHPLIPVLAAVHNDFTLEKKSEVVLITGSNMSGKSTFLKTIGVNFVLAFAGSVVNASKFETSLFRLFTCINISDSITDGISYFYAEVKRLKNLLNEIRSENDLMVFYLIDEIFKGTNNLERLIGSRSYIKTIAALNCTGFISTHDLELIKLEENISRVSNYHFKEDLSNGKMHFDYKLKKGPSPTTNALKIMEIEGLPVER